MKNRLLVLTDISSLQSGVREPDDGQSLIRLLLYSNVIDLEGLVASSNLGHGQVTRPELIHQAIDAYARVRANLLLHDSQFPTAEKLHEVVHAGQPIAGPKIPIENSIGEDKDTGASNWIIASVDRPDPRPLWVAVWGGTADLAQALWRVRATRTAAQLQAFLAKLRVNAIGDQDSTGAWIKANFPNLFYIWRERGYRGMYRGGDVNLVSSDWVKTNIHGHGALGDLYPDYKGGDIWSGALGPVRGIKEGDTPSFLGLIPNGLGDPSINAWLPNWGGWGGRYFLRAPQRWEDAVDTMPGSEADRDPRMSAVYRWRPAWQNDFAARLDWCVQPFSKANHAPQIKLNGETLRVARPGETINLDARGTTDPDGDAINYQWWIYREAGTFKGEINIENANTPLARFTAPRVDAPTEIHAILTAHDNGAPQLTSYARVVVIVEP